MEIYLLFLAAIAPVAVALWYIYKKDSVKPEPAKWLWKAFLYGVISSFLPIFFVPILILLANIKVLQTEYPFLDAIADAFVTAAIPEETAKLLMLWLLIRKNPYFDEKFDGIVYAVCIGMGFAGFENILYLIKDLILEDSWIETGVMRALSAIPGHFFDAVLMGYYFSLYHFGVDRSRRCKVMILAAPILAHGIYDGIVFCMEVSKEFAAIGMFVFLFFLHRLRKFASERIDELMEQ